MFIEALKEVQVQSPGLVSTVVLLAKKEKHDLRLKVHVSKHL